MIDSLNWRSLLDRYPWNLTPIWSQTKKPILPAWQEMRLTERELSEYLEEETIGVGVVLGETSGGLVDIDLDDPLAVELAEGLLPKTNCVFGHESKPSSHWLYISQEEIPYQKFKDPLTNKVILELRGKGRMTVVPPSIHPSGEPITFESFGSPEECDHHTLQIACTKLAIITLLIHAWPSLGTRHEVYLALSGALLLSGWDVTEVMEVVRRIANYVDTENPGYKLQIVQDTYETIERGDFPTNWRKLTKLLGEPVIGIIRRWVKASKPPRTSSGKASLDVTMDIHDLMWKSWGVLESTNDPPYLFQTGSTLVRIEEQDHQMILQGVDSTRLHNLLTGKIEYYRESDSIRQVSQPPGNLTDKLLADSYLPGRRDWIPEIDRVVDHPMITPDGEIISSLGYHPKWKTYITRDWTRVNTSMSLDESHAIIEDLLADFPFERSSHKTHAMALLLQPFVRLLISGNTPMYFFTAPMAGSGKTLLGKVLLIPSLGREPSPDPFPEDEAEMRKYLTSKLIRDRRLIFFDNVMRMPDLPTLSSALTTGRFESRILGSSISVVVQGPDTWAATGNNPEVHYDMSRRHIPVRLTPAIEAPALRTGFRHPRLLTYALENRDNIISAVCQVALDGLKKCQNGHTPTHPVLGSFESWSDTLGGILGSEGYPDFLEGVGSPSERVNPSKEFVGFWWDQWGEEKVFLRDLIPLANLLLPPTSGDSWTVRSLASQAEKLRDVVISGLKVTYADKYSGVDRWYLCPTGGEPIPSRSQQRVDELMSSQPTITITLHDRR